MLEFCQTVKPTLEDYEADGVSRELFKVGMFSYRLSCRLGPHFWTTLFLGRGTMQMKWQRCYRPGLIY